MITTDHLVIGANEHRVLVLTGCITLIDVCVLQCLNQSLIVSLGSSWVSIVLGVQRLNVRWRLQAIQSSIVCPTILIHSVHHHSQHAVVVAAAEQHHLHSFLRRLSVNLLVNVTGGQ